jgi:tRNA wybutosine-synthesizing protein 2
VDKTRAIVEEPGYVLIPVLGTPDKDLLAEYGGALIESHFPERKHRRDPIDEIRTRLALPPNLSRLLPDRWELLGNVLVVSLDPALDPYEKEIAEAYGAVLGAKAVLREVGWISGDLRTPVMRRVFGSDTITVHLENGIFYKFDAERIMFSSGNMEERMRMADTECKGETIVDMFAGIGYFSLPLAFYQKPSRIISCELNSVSYGFLKENISLNHVEDVIEPVLGDNRDLPGSAMADRVIMGYVKTTHEFLPTALRLLKGGGIIHYHETCPNALLPQRPLERLKEAGKGRPVEIVRYKEIKSYAPGVSHVVVDARFFSKP